MKKYKTVIKNPSQDFSADYFSVKIQAKYILPKPIIFIFTSLDRADATVVFINTEGETNELEIRYPP